MWQVPSKLHGRDDGRSSPGRNLSCSRQHLCHCHAGGFLGLFLSSIFPKMAILSRGFQKPFDKGLYIPGEPGRHRLLVLPDSIHLRRSFSGEKPAHFTVYNISTRCQVAYCAVQTTQFFTFYAGTGGGPQLRSPNTSLQSCPANQIWTKTNDILARDLFELFLFSISGSPLGDVTTSIRKCWR